ncbi:MAG: nucleotidyl transferase, partial [Ignavibacteriales bacterium]|nr:nucleotidyl transferase [Ignavibacteriales bacterium]
AGKPIIGHILDKIVDDGFDEATIIVGQMGDKIRDYVESHFKIQFDFDEQAEPKGLEHAISHAASTFSTEPILIILGDTIFDVNLKPVVKETYTSLGVKQVDDPRRFGVVEMKDGFVSKLIEKPEHPTSNLALVGLYWICNPKLLEQCIEDLFRKDKKTKGEYQLTDALQSMVERGEKVKTFNVEGWYDCGKPETLLETNRHLLDKTPNKVKIDGVVIVPPVFVAKSAKISRSIIGPYATIADCAVVEDSIIRNSIVSEEAEVARALLENSLIGSNAVIQGNYKRINIGDSSEIEFH